MKRLAIYAVGTLAFLAVALLLSACAPPEPPVVQVIVVTVEVEVTRVMVVTATPTQTPLLAPTYTTTPTVSPTATPTVVLLSKLAPASNDDGEAQQGTDPTAIPPAPTQAPPPPQTYQVVGTSCTDWANGLGDPPARGPDDGYAWSEEQLSTGQTDGNGNFIMEYRWCWYVYGWK